MYLALSNCQSDSGYSRDAALGTDEIKVDQLNRKIDESRRTTSIEGEVQRIDGHNHVVREKNGKEVRLHVDSTTQITEDIGQGYNIVVLMDDQNHALTMHSTPRLTVGMKSQRK